MHTAEIHSDRALGAVLGSAVGDALGAPFEFGPANGYHERTSEGSVHDNEMIGGGPFGWEAGEFTDDTAMGIVQAESLLRLGRIDGEDLFEAFRGWAAWSADVGNQTRAVLGSGLSWNLAAKAHFHQQPNGAAGNGSLMRCAGSAVLFAKSDLETSLDAARQLSAVTHGDPAAGCGCALLHGMVHGALRENDPLEVLDQLLISLPIDEERYRTILSRAWQPNGELPNGTVWACLAEAVWAVRTTTTFKDALVAAINLGGDTDTVAAVAGCIAGARYGAGSIPSRWRELLHGYVSTGGDVVTYYAQELESLTHRLLSTGMVATGGTKWPARTSKT